MTPEQHNKAQRIAYSLAVQRGGGSLPPYDPDAAKRDFCAASAQVLKDQSVVPTRLEDQLEVLDTFIESADELFNSAYLKQVQQNGLSVKREWTLSSLTASTTSPEHEAAKAVVLTLRMFCQNNDATSLGNVCLLYTSPSPRDQRGSRMPSSA